MWLVSPKEDKKTKQRGPTIENMNIKLWEIQMSLRTSHVETKTVLVMLSVDVLSCDFLFQGQQFSLWGFE